MSEYLRAYDAGFGAREGPPGELRGRPSRIRRHLPRADALSPAQRAQVLDLGGSPGRYTIWLAEHGHRVTVSNLSHELLAIARGGVGDRVGAVVEANARHLAPWGDGAFDAVVCLGPFYHLPARPTTPGPPSSSACWSQAAWRSSR